MTDIVKLGFTGTYLFFLLLLQNIDCGYFLERPQGGGQFLRVLTINVLSKNKKKTYITNLIFTVDFFSVYCSMAVMSYCYVKNAY